MRSLILFLSFLAGTQAAAIEYTTESGRVALITNELVPGTESNLSNTKCIEFTAGAPTEYTTGCVTSLYSGNDQFESCQVSFDDIGCNSCELCTDAANVTLVGMTLNCNNKLPSKNIQSTCLVYSDAAVQEILDEGYFTEPFDFEAAAGDDGEPAPAISGALSVLLKFSWVSIMALVAVVSLL